MKKKNTFEKLIFPDYDESIFFNISVTLLCIGLLVNEVRQSIIDTIFHPTSENLTNMAIILPYIVIIIDSIYHAFVKKKKKFYEILWLLIFSAIVIFMNTLFIIEYLCESQNYMFIFIPALNLIHIIYIFVIMRFGEAQDREELVEYLYSDKELELHEVIIGLLINVWLFILTYYILNYHWSVTLNICISYTVIISKKVNNLIFNLYRLLSGKYKDPEIIE